MPDRLTTVITAAPGGVMTDEVGVVTGDVELASSCTPDGEATATCRYRDADEWYTVTDAKRSIGSADALPAFHDELVAKYREA